MCALNSPARSSTEKHRSSHAIFASPGKANSLPSLPKCRVNRQSHANASPDSASSRTPCARVVKAASSLPESAGRVPRPAAFFPDSPQLSLPAGDRRNRACRSRRPREPEPDPHDGWCGGGGGRAPHWSRFDRATYRNCTRIGTGANSGKPAESFPGKCREHLRGDERDSEPAAGRLGRSAAPNHRTPDGRLPEPYGQVACSSASLTAAACRASDSSATAISIAPTVFITELDSTPAGGRFPRFRAYRRAEGPFVSTREAILAAAGPPAKWALGSPPGARFRRWVWGSWRLETSLALTYSFYQANTRAAIRLFRSNWPQLEGRKIER